MCCDQQQQGQRQADEDFGTLHNPHRPQAHDDIDAHVSGEWVEKRQQQAQDLLAQSGLSRCVQFPSNSYQWHNLETRES